MTEFEALLVIELSRTMVTKLDKEFMGLPLTEVRDVLRRVHVKVSPLCAKPSRERVLAMLFAIAAVFNVELPTKEGLKLIVTALAERIPEHLLSKAAEQVIGSHRFKTMPTPAEIVAGVEEEAIAERNFLQNIVRGGSKINSVLAFNRAFTHHNRHT